MSPTTIFFYDLTIPLISIPYLEFRILQGWRAAISWSCLLTGVAGCQTMIMMLQKLMWKPSHWFTGDVEVRNNTNSKESSSYSECIYICNVYMYVDIYNHYFLAIHRQKLSHNLSYYYLVKLFMNIILFEFISPIWNAKSNSAQFKIISIMYVRNETCSSIKCYSMIQYHLIF